MSDSLQQLREAIDKQRERLREAELLGRLGLEDYSKNLALAELALVALEHAGHE